MIAKFAQLYGLAMVLKSRLLRRPSQLVEYKGASTPTASSGNNRQPESRS